MKKIKILHVVNIPFVIPYFFGEQIHFFNELGFEVHIACTKNEKLYQYSYKYKFVALPLIISREILPLTDIVSIFKLYRYIKSNNIDTVVGHTPKGALIAMASSFLAGCSKRVYFCHGLMFETSIGIKRKLLMTIETVTSMLSTKVICVSESVLNKRIYYELSRSDKLIVVNRGSCNGINAMEEFNPSLISSNKLIDLREKYSIRSNDKVVGYIGRLANDKGINELIAAWKIVKKNNLNCKLFLCGPIDDRDPLNSDSLNQIYSDNSITYVGEINKPSLYYSLFDMFIFPSYREGLPTAILEASSMSVPVITSRSTGCINAIIENFTGIYCELDVIDISLKIEYYLKNNKIAKIHGKNGREFILKNFNQHKFWQELLNIYSNE